MQYDTMYISIIRRRRVQRCRETGPSLESENALVCVTGPEVQKDDFYPGWQFSFVVTGDR